MEDLTKLTLDEAREKLKRAGVGSTIRHKSQMYTIIDFDAAGDPQVARYTFFWADNVILIKTANTQAAVTYKFKKGDRVLIVKGMYKGNHGAVTNRVSSTGPLTSNAYSVNLDNGTSISVVGEGALQKALDYPTIGSIWISKSFTQDQIKITAHDKNIAGEYVKDNVQYMYLSGTYNGSLANLSLTGFYNCFKKVLNTNTDDTKAACNLMDPVSGRFPAKQTNDGRTTCYACGAPTKAIGCLPGSQMMLCTKCKK